MQNEQLRNKLRIISANIDQMISVKLNREKRRQVSETALLKPAADLLGQTKDLDL